MTALRSRGAPRTVHPGYGGLGLPSKNSGGSLTGPARSFIFDRTEPGRGAVMSLNVIEAATNIAASNSLFPAIATLSNGDYVVATIPFTSDFNLDEVIVTQVFDSQGNPVATGTVSQPFFTP